MKTNLLTGMTIPAILLPFATHADLVAHFPMNVEQGYITEQLSGDRFAVEGHFLPENVAGAVGEALRFDGYTSYINAHIGDIIAEGSTKMSVSMWVALPCYPIIEIDKDTKEQTPIVSCLDEQAKTGFGFFIGFDGKWQFKTFVGGWPVNVEINDPLPVYQWNNLTAVVDCDAKIVTVYNNGVEMGSARCNGTLSLMASQLQMGHGNLQNYAGPFLLSSYNGLIDDIKIWNEAIQPSVIQSWKPENEADLSIPASRFADDLLRPKFHGMPAAAWTNECHGMVWADGRYHLFFQKNANGPYMARLHWGHISSENLYDWHEEEIALAPGNPYDIKGCWSGCVFSDNEITGGKPNILYTAVDYAKATIAGASPEDDSLIKWTKWNSNPIITGRPDGLSDDFRDPYFFRHDNKAYIIVGTSKDGVGATTLHEYDPASKSWSNDGRIFFAGANKAQSGRFWEMPNITPMGNGKWLFTATPLETGTGVRTLYWTGTINADGTFNPDSQGRNVELDSRDGFGLLSPTIYTHEGKTIALGIVPDKLSSQDNWNLGWAHCYSLPREWSLADNGELIQKPSSLLTGLRSATNFQKSDFELDGELSLAPVEGRSAEICATFIAGSNPCGFKLFKNESGACVVSFNPASNSIKVDFSSLNRLVNDGGVYDGVYTLSLPELIKQGSDLKLNIFIDHSILDIFVNDHWASSIRLFPTDTDATGIEAFSEGTTTVKQLNAWICRGEATGINEIGGYEAPHGELVDVYSLTGQKIRIAVKRSEATAGLPAGLYIAGNRKILVK